MSQNRRPLTRVQLTQRFQWEDNLPQAIQDRLFEHYTKFHQSESDIQSVSDTLF